MTFWTVDKAFAAGMAHPCAHGQRPPQCERCRLTPAEIGAIAVLLDKSQPHPRHAAA